MARLYTVEFENQSITNANGDYDFFELQPQDDKPLFVHGLFIEPNSEVGDAQEEFLRWSIVRGNATTGNGTATTPQPLDPNDSAASFVAEVVASTPASAGTPVDIHSGAFNVRVGLQVWWTPETRPMTTQAAGFLCVRLLAAVADDITCSGTIYVEEL